MTREYIIENCVRYEIINYTINDDLSIDVKDDVNLSNEGLTELPLVFNIVDGYFDCSLNSLTNLKGAPRKCKNFYCYSNKLTSLNGVPDECGDFIICHSNNLSTLIGAPRCGYIALIGAPRCGYIAFDYNNLNLDNEELYVIEALAKFVYNSKYLKDYLKIRKRSETINAILN